MWRGAHRLMLLLLVAVLWDCAQARAANPPPTPAPTATPAPAKPAVPAPVPNPPPSPAPQKPATPPPPPTPPAPPPAPPPKPEEKLKYTALQVEPSKAVLKGRFAAQQLVVMGRLPDGSLRDCTAGVEFATANPKVAEVGKEGLIRPAGNGDVAISVTLRSGSASIAVGVQITVKDAGYEEVDFYGSVWPLLTRLGCNQTACHGAGQGKGGFQLSMFGAEPEEDFHTITLAAHGRRLNRIEPQKSLFLLKPTTALPHGGAQRLTVGSTEYQILAHWIAQGAPRGEPQTPALTALNVYPTEQTLGKGETQQLLVTASYADGSQKDVTRLALFKACDARAASVSPAGQVKAEEYGESAICVGYARQAAVVRIAVPQPLAGPFPNFPPHNKIDELVIAKLARLGIPPAELSGDADFVRRVFLDVIGTLPSADEARAFLADKDPQKRAKLIDSLLARREFADFWAVKWSDLLRIKSEYPVNVWPKAVQVYNRWLRTSLAQNKPYDQFVRELLISGGSNYRDPPANYYRAMPIRNPQSFAETTALVFMGVRLNCVRCHGHPWENWSLDDNLGMAAFFGKVAFKATQEWKEEVVYFNADGGVWHQRAKLVVKPKTLGGPPQEFARDDDPRGKFADWLTAPDNPWFARNIVNRIWAALLGRGIVHEPDDLRPTNPPENPELLEFLRQELIGHKFDLKYIFRLILNSRTYQLSSETCAANEKDVAHFSHYPLKRLGAEQILDAVCQVTGSPEQFNSWIPVPMLRLPMGQRAIQLPDGDIESSFLEIFGRPSRDTPFESERSCEASLRQALFMYSSDQLQGKIAAGERIKRIVEAKKGDPEALDELYLTAFARPPRDDEKQRALQFLTQHKDARVQALQDLLWAVLSTKEFMVNH